MLLPPARKRTMLHKFIAKFFVVFVFVFIIQSFGFQYTCNVQRWCIWRQLSTLEPVKAYCSSKFWYILYWIVTVSVTQRKLLCQFLRQCTHEFNWIQHVGTRFYINKVNISIVNEEKTSKWWNESILCLMSNMYLLRIGESLIGMCFRVCEKVCTFQLIDKMFYKIF